jgi:hypothetical protein
METLASLTEKAMPYVLQAFACTVLGYPADLGYGRPEYDHAVSVARRWCRARIASVATRQDVSNDAAILAARFLADGYHPTTAGTEAASAAWRRYQDEGIEQATAPADLAEHMTEQEGWEYRINGTAPAGPDASYRTRTQDHIGYALQALPELERTLVTAYAQVDGWQSSRFPTAALVAELVASHPHTARALDIVGQAMTGRRGVKFADTVRAALAMFADAYTDTLHHDAHDARRRCEQPAPTLYVLPERVGMATPVPGDVVKPRRILSTDRDYRFPTYSDALSAKRAGWAEQADAVTRTARQVKGARPGMPVGNSLAGESSSTPVATLTSKRATRRVDADNAAHRAADWQGATVSEAHAAPRPSRTLTEFYAVKQQEDAERAARYAAAAQDDAADDAQLSLFA